MWESSGKLIKAMIIGVIKLYINKISYDLNLEKQDEESFYPETDSCSSTLE